MIKIVRDPAISGYAHANVAVKPWIAFVGQEQLKDAKGRVRRFASKLTATEAATKEEARQERASRYSRPIKIF
jgi:hypothetical protein